MNVEGITLTQEMIDNIKFWQENPQNIQSSVEVFDRAISFIARGSDGSDQEQARRGLQLISSLCCVKEMVVSFAQEGGIHE